MLAYVSDVGWVIAVIVEALLLFLLATGPFRKFLVLFIYVAVDLASTSAFTLADLLYRGALQVTAARASEEQKLYTHLYWTGEVILDLLLFLTVILFTYRATEGGPLRPAVGKLLGTVVVLALVLPFLVFHPTFTPWPKGLWFNSTSQMLNFGGAIMNLALWAALIASKQRDRQLLTVSAGLGIVVTGGAISFGLRYLILEGALRSIPDLLLLVTHLGGLIIWCLAFRPAHRLQPAASDAVPSL